MYKFQTNEGAAQGTMEHALSVSVGLSGHTTPAAPKVTNTGGTATVIDKTNRGLVGFVVKLVSLLRVKPHGRLIPVQSV